MVGARKSGDERITDIGRRPARARLYWAVEVASAVVAGDDDQMDASRPWPIDLMMLLIEASPRLGGGPRTKPVELSTARLRPQANDADWICYVAEPQRIAEAARHQRPRSRQADQVCWMT